MPCYTKVQIQVTHEGSALDALLEIQWFKNHGRGGQITVDDKAEWDRLREYLKARVTKGTKPGTFNVSLEDSARGQFLQAYGVVEATRKARAQGYQVMKTTNPDGRVILTARRFS